MQLSRRDRTTVALAGAGFVAGAWAARRGEVTATEARWFARLNGLPSGAFAPVWTVMQLGSLGGSVGLGLAVAASGRRRLGSTLALTAAATWAGAKVVKPGIQRGRPNGLVGGARVLGREQAGLGYPSGHAAVASALAAVAAPHLTSTQRLAAWATAGAVALARIYVGAHLPLDVIGGVALGTAIGTAAAPYGSRRPPRSSSSSWASCWRG
ncbi:MAG: phosphatase PAP2 family protein [Acidimicrobiales bacterium]